MASIANCNSHYQWVWPWGMGIELRCTRIWPVEPQLKHQMSCDSWMYLGHSTVSMSCVPNETSLAKNTTHAYIIAFPIRFRTILGKSWEVHAFMLASTYFPHVHMVENACSQAQYIKNCLPLSVNWSCFSTCEMIGTKLNELRTPLPTYFISRIIWVNLGRQRLENQVWNYGEPIKHIQT